ncbi:plasmid pRiA4b ORF-3 family protein [Pseudonocardia sp. NPDC046786]|uniref:plasmid pRiA4b ORF-3 family protein n=1 Tax=Pseudonocardia sp. NPDC046786 TaxID=3155471 RepID=UPI0033FDD3D3
MERAPDEPVNPEELRRRLQEQLAALDDPTAAAAARRILGGLIDNSPFDPVPAPSARRPRRADVVTYRIRVDLRDTSPPLWRRLELASDIRLDELNTVLQTAFGWTDSHLHRFSSGPSIHDHRHESYLMPFEIEEGEPGIPEGDVRIDELLVEVGDRITYGYDFGDDWTHTVRLEAVLPRPGDAPRAVCTAGRRPGPPEDCGGVDGYEMWCAATDPTHAQHTHAVAEIQDLYGPDIDLTAHAPTTFDIDDINTILAHSAPDDTDLPEPLAARVRAIGAPAGQTWLRAALDAVPRPEQPDETTAAVVVHSFTWLLDQVGTDGIELTDSGYLPPAQVRAVAVELGIDREWIGTLNREAQTIPVLAFREAAQQLRLIRRYRGKLVRTPAGRRLATDPIGLWSHLAARLPIGSGTEGYERDAGLLLLIGIAAGREDLDAYVARGLDALGWKIDGRPVTPSEAIGASLGTRTVLHRIGAIERAPRRTVATELGAAFARAAAWTWP